MQSWRTQHLREQKRTILVSTGDTNKILIENNKSAVLSCEFHKTGQVLVSSNSAGQIHICPTLSGSEKLTYLKGHRESVTEVCYSSDGLDVYSGSVDRTIGIWDAFRGVRKTAIIGHSDKINTIACLRAEKPLFCSGSSDKVIRLWDVRQKECGALLKGYQEVLATCFSGCGNYLFSGGLADGDITVWDIRRGESVWVLAGHTAAVTGLSLSPCRRFLASCSTDGTIRTWDVSSETEIGVALNSFPLKEGIRIHPRRCAWSPNAKLLSAGTVDGLVAVIDATSGKRVCDLDGHGDEITCVAFHPFRKILMSAGADKKLILHCM